MQNFRTLGQIIKKVHTFFYLTQKYIKIIHFPSKIQNWKNFYFLIPILSAPYLGPNMCGRFHAKFQDSRTNNKKSTHVFALTQKYIKIFHFSSKIQNWKHFYFLKMILSAPYLCPNICGRFHAKFQDSRTKNKKSTHPSDPKRPLAIYTTVWF